MAKRSDIKQPLIAAALIVVVTVIVAVGGVVFKTRDQVNRDKVELVADSNAKQVAPLRRVIQLRLAQDKSRLVQFAANRSSLGPGRSRIFGDFAMVSLIVPSGHGHWGVAWVEKGPLYPRLQSNTVMLTPDQEIALLKSLPFDRIKNGESYWQRLSDSRGRPLWSLTVAVETQTSGKGGNPTVAPLPEGTDYTSVQVGTGTRAFVIGLFGSNPLTTATEDYIGSSSSAFVIDSRGYAATHSNKTMIGAMMKDDIVGGPVTKEILQSRSSAGAIRYKTSSGNQVFSAFEQVDRSNLYVVMATPDTVIATTSDSFGRTAVTTGALAIVVGLLLVFAWGAKLLPRFTGGLSLGADRYTRPEGPDVEGNLRATNYVLANVGHRRQIEPVTLDMRRPIELPDEFRKPMASPISSAAAPPIVRTPEAVDQGRILKGVVTGMEASLKEPVLAALAHVQLANGKLKELAANRKGEEAVLPHEIREHVEMIERDLRRAKDTIDEFSRLGVDSHPPKDGDRADVWNSLRRVLDRMRSELQDQGITVLDKTQPAPMIRGLESSLESIFEELLTNARRALQGRNEKTLRIELRDLGDSVQIVIQDNGVGMDREARRRAFDPFFHIFDDPGAKGFGLTKARAIADSHEATLEIDSSPGDGTTVAVRFPVQKHEREIFESARLERSGDDGRRAVATASARDRKRNSKTDRTATARPDSNGSITEGETVAGSGSSYVDFGREGAISLGGKVPLPSEKAIQLPPPPRPGMDEGPEFRHHAAVTEDPEKTQVSIAVQVIDEADDSKTDDTIRVKVRPVQRG